MAIRRRPQRRDKYGKYTHDKIADPTNRTSALALASTVDIEQDTHNEQRTTQVKSSAEYDDWPEEAQWMLHRLMDTAFDKKYTHPAETRKTYTKQLTRVLCSTFPDQGYDTVDWDSEILELKAERAANNYV